MIVSSFRASRRRFLTSTLAAGAGLLLPGRLQAERPATDANRFALMSDIHISSDRKREARGVNLVQHFLRVRDEILALRPRPGTVFVSGDCAFNEGLSSDYAAIRELVEPLRHAGLKLHLLMGNHDRRKNLWEVFPEYKPRAQGLPPDRHTAVVESPYADWFLLDSMDEPGVVAGRLGEAQLRWLARALDARPNKPALVMAHHYPASYGKSGLVDSEDLFKLLLPRKQVKAFLFGHSHRWGTDAVQGLLLVNLPTTAYVFDKTQPCGWVQVQLRPDGITLRLNSLDRQHPSHGKVLDFVWRK
jgi:3',5'-cyclic AMP phosphodiesterase CpdA